MTPALFTVGIGIRAVLLAAIAFAVIELLSAGHLYATAFVTACVGAFVLADLTRYVSRGDRMLERFVDGIAAGEFERPARSSGTGAGFQHFMASAERAVSSLSAARAAQQRQIDHLQTLIDNVSVAMLVIERTGVVTLANRAARQLAQKPIHRLEQIVAIGASAASQLEALAAGQRAVVRFANGQRVLASTARFTAAGVSCRLFSLQNIGGELDAVELKAWQDLVRILAHEMMNSLTPIVSLAQSVRPLLSDAPVSQGEDVASAIDTIARRSTGLMSFVDRYRKITELPRPALQTVRLRELTTRVEQLMSAMLVEKGIAYSSVVEPAGLEISADPDLLEQVLINLIHNAVDALSCAESPRIDVHCRLEEDCALLTVLDNGRGVDAAFIERIFVPFFTTRPGGSGIGLNLARQIAHAHGGRLELSRREPPGAAFTLVLPA